MSDHHLDLEKLLQSLVEKVQNGDSLTPEQSTQAQSILSNVKCRDLTTGNITQILFIIQRSELFKPIGIPDNIPRSGTVKFVGRADAIKNLFEKLQQNNLLAITAIEGMGGVGKTELAIQYTLIHRLLKTYKGGICWLLARNEDVGLQIVEFARNEFKLEPPEKFDLPAQVKFCWSHWQEGDVLVVIDDVEDYSKVKRYLPPQLPRFKVLITTRLKELPLLQHLKLDVLSESEALELLEGWVGEEKVKQELKDAKKICNFLGCLPLALNLVGAYVRQRRKITLAEMLKRLETKNLEQKSLQTPNQKTNTSYIERGVSDAFELNWEELSEPAQWLGCLLSLFALAPISLSLVKSAAVEQEPEKLEDAIVELQSLYLLIGEETYQLHQLIREFLKNKQNNLESANEQKQNLCEALVKVAQDIPSSPTLELITTVKDAIPHLAEVAQNLIDAVSDENLTWVFFGLSRFYSGQGLYAIAEPWDKQCVSVVQSRLGEEHPDVASSLNNLAGLYKNQGRYAEAEPLYQQALALTIRLLGEAHPSVATSLNNLALLYKNQGRYAEAEPLYKKALEIAELSLGVAHPKTIIVRKNYADFLQNYANFLRNKGGS